MKETMDSIAARADDCMGRGDWDGAERVFLAALAEAEDDFFDITFAPAEGLLVIERVRREGFGLDDLGGGQVVLG